MATFKGLKLSHEDAMTHNYERQQSYFDVYLLKKKDEEDLSKIWRQDYKSKGKGKKPAEVKPQIVNAKNLDNKEDLKSNARKKKNNQAEDGPGT